MNYRLELATLKAAGSNRIIYLLVQQLDDHCEVLDAKVWRPTESGIVDMSITLNNHFRKLIFTAMVENETGETIPPYTWIADFHFVFKS